MRDSLAVTLFVSCCVQCRLRSRMICLRRRAADRLPFRERLLGDPRTYDTHKGTDIAVVTLPPWLLA